MIRYDKLSFDTTSINLFWYNKSESRSFRIQLVTAMQWLGKVELKIMCDEKFSEKYWKGFLLLSRFKFRFKFRKFINKGCVIKMSRVENFLKINKQGGGVGRGGVGGVGLLLETWEYSNGKVILFLISSDWCWTVIVANFFWHSIRKN